MPHHHASTTPAPAPGASASADQILAPDSIVTRRVLSARTGNNPTVIGRAASGWIVIGDQQHLRGYCLLLADPIVPRLNDLHGPARTTFLSDMAALGDAVLAVTGAARINYEILGNLDPALHAHVFPRYESEPADLRTKPIWLYPENLSSQRPFDPERDRSLMEQIRVELQRSGTLTAH